MIMDVGSYRNVSFATAAGLSALLDRGKILTVREQSVREIMNRVTVLEQASERCLFLPRRGNNVFASLAETMWVIAGRNDISWLQRYLPRAPDYSDDGLTWRGGYGPRLRNWNGIDQLAAIRELLLSETLTRRAVMTIFDPDRDYVRSKDIPCNNWLHWLIRDGRLHLNVAVRSHDILWGFSGVNSFEWSVLQEIMAFWVGVPAGETAYFASSFHLYDRHHARAKNIVAAFRGITCYDFGLLSPPFQTNWEDFHEMLKAWFALEGEARLQPNQPISVCLGDPLLDGAVRMLRLYHGSTLGWSVTRLRDELAALPATDLTAAAYEYFSRKHSGVLDSIPDPSIATFFTTYLDPGRKLRDQPCPLEIKQLIKCLHRNKDAAYGNAWKKRGELTSILANVARKIDRLEQFTSTGSNLLDETTLDTAIDLFVYLTKYRLFLMDLSPEIAAGVLPANSPHPFSDHYSNFDSIVDGMGVPQQVSKSEDILARSLIVEFEVLHAMASNSATIPQMRFERASSLANLALRLVVAISQHTQEAARALQTSVLRMSS